MCVCVSVKGMLFTRGRVHSLCGYQRERDTHRTLGGGGGDLKIQFFSVYNVVFTKLLILETRD